MPYGNLEGATQSSYPQEYPQDIYIVTHRDIHRITTQSDNPQGYPQTVDNLYTLNMVEHVFFIHPNMWDFPGIYPNSRGLGTRYLACSTNLFSV